MIYAQWDTYDLEQPKALSKDIIYLDSFVVLRRSSQCGPQSDLTIHSRIINSQLDFHCYEGTRKRQATGCNTRWDRK